MPARCDAVIVGGGVAGSSCAILLAQAGWSVVLIEKQEFPRRKVCGECIAASNLALIDALGVGEKFRAIAGPALRRAAWCSGDRVIEAELPQLVGDSPYPWGRALGREHLDTLLLDRAREVGATILQPCTVRCVDRVAGLHQCTTVDSAGHARSIEAAVLIDAHGSWQPGPFALTTRPRRSRASDLFAFKANFSAARLADGVLPVLAFAGGYGGMVQGDHGLLTLACCIRRDRLQRWREQHRGVAAGEAVQMLLEQEIRAVREALRGANREGAWLAVGPIWPRIGKPQLADGAFAVGNAAGEAHPILGEGISMAIQSAFLLCERLLGSSGDIGSDYAASWRRAFASRVRLAALYAHIAMNPLANRVALPLLKRWPQLLSHGARMGSKTRCVVDPRRSALRPSASDS
jgi:2-polyprenyl-6-methoxyphenol hydroxylase-like FAD-dependent oxidoreductase